jgi:hypothetical protein
MAELKPVIVSQDSSNNAASANASKRTKLTRSLATDRIRLDRQLQILRAFGALSAAASKAVSIAEVAEMTGMKASTIGIAIPFFVSVQLIQKNEAGYSPSAEVINMLRAHDWNTETAPQKLAPALRRTWFAEELLPKLAFGPMAEGQAIQKLGELACAGPEHEPQLRMLIEYLASVGLIERDGGVLKKAAKSEDVGIPEPEQSTLPQKELPRSKVNTAFSQNPSGSVEFNIAVQVDMSEMATWQADRIAAFFGGLAQVLAAKADIERKG